MFAAVLHALNDVFADGDGILDASELKAWNQTPSMGAIGIESDAVELNETPNPLADQEKGLRTMFQKVDTNGSGEIDHEELLLIFEMFVTDKSAIQGNDDDLSAGDLTSAMINDYGTDGVLSFEQFHTMIDKDDFWPLLSSLADENASIRV